MRPTTSHRVIRTPQLTSGQRDAVLAFADEHVPTAQRYAFLLRVGSALRRNAPRDMLVRQTILETCVASALAEVMP